VLGDMMSAQRSIDILAVHREALLQTKTFEEYRDCHVAYIDMLIEQLGADIEKDNSIKKWMAVLDKVVPVPES
jgi:hypothetical protein